MLSGMLLNHWKQFEKNGFRMERRDGCTERQVQKFRRDSNKTRFLCYQREAETADEIEESRNYCLSLIGVD